VASHHLDLLAASLRADASDRDAFVEGLAAKLEQVIPDHVRVYRWRGGFRRAKRVRKITLDAAGRRFELRASPVSIETTSSRLSGGIVLKTETLDTESWLTALGEALAAEADRSERTRLALERLLTR
jgi:hypothetical protein